MKKLTKKEQENILRAAVRIELGFTHYSCIAIASGKWGNADENWDLRRRYDHFTAPNHLSNWLEQELMSIGDVSTNRKELRVLLLLNFLEANK